MKARDTFGTIFLVVGIVLFYFIGSTSIASELDDILHGPRSQSQFARSFHPRPMT